MEPVYHLKPGIVVKEIHYPTEIFGNFEEQTILRPIRTAACSILKTVASMLLDPRIVGNNGENYIECYAKQYNFSNERVYGNVTSANCFKKTEAAVRMKYGDDVYVLALSIGTDKTYPDRLNCNAIWPCNVTILNLVSSVLHSRKSSEIIGQCAILPYSDHQIEKILEMYDVKGKSNRQLTSRYLKRYIEQQFLHIFFNEIKEARKDGPVSFIVHGKGILKMWPDIFFYRCKKHMVVYIYYLYKCLIYSFNHF